jgi:formate hydrogenlyase transcriptional activator
LTPEAAIAGSENEFRPCRFEREHILDALRETGCGWVVGGPKGAAARLGMKRSTLYKRMTKLRIFRLE